MVSAVTSGVGGWTSWSTAPATRMRTRPSLSSPLDVWETIMDINVKGTFLCAREAAKDMLKQGRGKIINISSLQGFGGQAGDPAYAASKAAVNLMTKSMACEWAARGHLRERHRPDMVLDRPDGAEPQPQRFLSRIKERIPAGRAGNREDLFGIADLPGLGRVGLRQRGYHPARRGRDCI